MRGAVQACGTPNPRTVPHHPRADRRPTEEVVEERILSTTSTPRSARTFVYPLAAAWTDGVMSSNLSALTPSAGANRGATMFAPSYRALHPSWS